MVQSSDPVGQWQGKRFGAEPNVAFESDVRACDGQRLGYTLHYFKTVQVEVSTNHR
ncbi:hypothetical protein CY34DRAFT_804373 [Suillus luteus UH-Slu-Lm8-n1]|uniref:Unplaced genomic scaffold CY34scaffold_94, whole genome shotgun sequence n=1 Tax=Suillus luteus UH-Slu-Lm8-n1 TaxID=930992 RepID=A0A0D0BIH0_9AGAM|nr:hypothetical protein CY34DRAFT_804373 [Suillus luteus UH-Slu-Lm8-n1]